VPVTFYTTGVSHGSNAGCYIKATYSIYKQTAIHMVISAGLIWICFVRD